jgi:hypothetical protein
MHQVVVAATLTSAVSFDGALVDLDGMTGASDVLLLTPTKWGGPNGG